MEKKYMEVSKQIMPILVLSSSFGIRSKFSRIVRVAVATMPAFEELTHITSLNT
jgi:hypothetical protein